MAEIRNATLGDIDDIVLIQAKTWMDSYASEEHGITKDDLRSIDWNAKAPGWRHMIMSPDYEVLVAAEDSTIVAFATLDNTAEPKLDSLYVLSEYQGNEIGSRLLRSVMNGLQSVALQVASYNAKAIGFYEKFGFVRTGIRSSYILPSGKSIPTIEMLHKEGEASSDSVKLVGRKELSSISGERESTIKWYSEIGLLPFHQDDNRKRRRYDLDRSLEALKRIRDFKVQGDSIEEVKKKL